jgi:hypothetical protein
MFEWLFLAITKTEVATNEIMKNVETNAITQNKAISLFLLASVILATTILSTTIAFAAPKPKTPSIPAFPGTLVNARYVYVTSYDGDQFDPNLLSSDREAISAVQDAIQKWGKFTLVYQYHQADIVLMVMSRPSEDVLAVYDAHGWPGNQYLWRMMGRSGLQASETPLVTNLEKAFDQATTK